MATVVENMDAMKDLPDSLVSDGMLFFETFSQAPEVEICLLVSKNSLLYPKTCGTSYHHWFDRSFGRRKIAAAFPSHLPSLCLPTVNDHDIYRNIAHFLGENPWVFILYLFVCREPQGEPRVR